MRTSALLGGIDVSTYSLGLSVTGCLSCKGTAGWPSDRRPPASDAQALFVVAALTDNHCSYSCVHTCFLCCLPACLLPA